MNNRYPVPSFFNVMAKPIGSKCNLTCTYCYYLDKEEIYKDQPSGMQEETLEQFVKQYIHSQDSEQVTFVWQGGEPTLRGIDFFEKVVKLQQKYCGGKQIYNALQTNGMFLDENWGSFLKNNNFLVGISIDGPQYIHDYYRKTKNGRPSFKRVMKRFEFLHKYGIKFNTLSAVHRYSQEYPAEVYRFLKSIGSEFMQFLPVVERQNSSGDTNLSRFTHHLTTKTKVTDWSVTPHGYGDFLIYIFDEWIKHDVGRYFVQMFDVTLANWLGKNPGLCVHKDYCGDAMVVERNGDVYACDHFVYNEYFRGNIHEKSLKDLYFSQNQIRFGQNKKFRLPERCKQCPVQFACHGDCPKNRFVPLSEDQKPITYLCQGLFNFFQHVRPDMDFMANELKNNRPPANIMAQKK